MRSLLIITVLTLSAPLSAKAAGSPSAGLPTFSSSDHYNGADHAGSPLGWLEVQKSTLSMDLAYRYYKLDFGSDGQFQKLRSFAAPHIRLANPGSMVLDLQYSPHIIEHDVSLNQKLPLNRFGLSLAGGIPSGAFQTGVKIGFLVGKESQVDLVEKRQILGSDEVSFHLGSQVHELVRLGFSAGAKGYLDTMVHENISFQDRYFTGTFPLIGGFIDVGKNGFPVRSNFNLGLGINRFVYAFKPFNIRSDENTIQGDSIGWDWRVMGDIPAANMSFSPAVQIGYWRSTSRVYLPEGDNYPWQRGEELADSNWTVSSFGMGFGVAAHILKYVDGNLEYSFKNLSLECGPAYSAFNDRKDWYNRVLLSIQGNVHQIEALKIPESIQLVLRAGFFNFRQNLNFDTWYQEQFSYLEPIESRSQLYRYNPGSTFRNSRVIGFTAGVGSTFLNRMFAINTDLSFLSDKRSSDANGFEFGIDLSYNLHKNQE